VRLSWKKNGGTVELTSEHREADAGPAFEYRIEWDHETRTIRLAALEEDVPDDELVAKVERFLKANPEASANDVFKALGGRKKRVLAAVKTLREGGSGNHREPPLFSAPEVVPPMPPFRGLGNHSDQVVPGTDLGEDIPW
jgi:hypothetical protein